MDTNRLNGKFLKTAVYLLPFLFMLCAGISYVFSAARQLRQPSNIIFISFYLLFLLSLSAVFGNLIMEYALCVFEDVKKSSLKKLLYADKHFLPLRSFVFVIIFIGIFLFFASMVQRFSPLQILVFAVPPVGVFLNAPRFLSGRIRYVGGSYVCCQRGFCILFSYRFNEDGALVFITDDGSQIETGVTAAQTDFKALEAEFQKNSLPFSGQK